jgi:hypothetical protein
MNKNINRLNTRVIGSKAAGCYADGGGLYLEVKRSGGRSWIFRHMLRGRARAMGLGPTHTISLVEARGKALDCRRQLLNGIDPIDARRALVAAKVGSEETIGPHADEVINLSTPKKTDDADRRRQLSRNHRRVSEALAGRSTSLAFMHTHSFWLVFLTIVDLGVVHLIWDEYQLRKRG